MLPVHGNEYEPQPPEVSRDHDSRRLSTGLPKFQGSPPAALGPEDVLEVLMGLTHRRMRSEEPQVITRSQRVAHGTHASCDLARAQTMNACLRLGAVTLATWVIQLNLIMMHLVGCWRVGNSSIYSGAMLLAVPQRSNPTPDGVDSMIAEAQSSDRGRGVTAGTNERPDLQLEGHRRYFWGEREAAWRLHSVSA